MTNSYEWVVDAVILADLVYIGVAAKTRNKYLISTDFDYNDRVIEYLQEKMEITHHNTKQALNRCGLIV